MAAAVLMAGQCWAAVQLDQSAPAGEAGFDLGSSANHYQQEVMVGLSGTLVQFDLFVATPGNALVCINAGAPWQTDAHDWEGQFAPSGRGWIPVDVSAAGLEFTAGDRFVIDIVGADSGLLLYGSIGDYPSGALFHNGSPYSDPAQDIGFNTYMDSDPTPTPTPTPFDPPPPTATPTPIPDPSTAGDLDGDTYITTADALLCFQFALAIYTPTPEQEILADVDHDSNITTADALCIFQEALEIPNGCFPQMVLTRRP